MIKNIYIILFVLVIAACSKKYEIVDNPASSVLDYPRFQRNNADGSFADNRYSLSKVSNGNSFHLQHHGKIFFNGNVADHYYLEEIFNDRFLFITVNKKPNIWSSVSLVPRDSVFMYDMGSRKLFYLSAKGFRFSSVKFQSPLSNPEVIMKQVEKGYDLMTVIDSVDMANDELHLLYEDYKTKAIVSFTTVLE